MRAAVRSWAPLLVTTRLSEHHASDPPPAADAAAPPVVASVPSGHVYVRHLAPEGGGGPVRMPDPDPDGGPDGRVAAPTQRWWPPVMLDPAWAEAATDVDLFHVHFGFDAREPRDLQAFVDVLRRRGTPLVYTAHDLRNPHHESRALHDAQLDVLVPAADRVVTLTEGAAVEIRRRWDREAVVLPHPHVVPFETMRAARSMREVARRAASRRPFRVGVHVKSLRASMAPLPVITTLAETLADLPDAVLQVNAHRDVLEPGGARHDAGLASTLRRLEAAGRIELHVHDYLSDDDLWRYLSALDVSVLPYRFGTHSGWLEACRDLGTTVVAPSCGYFADQGPVLTYAHDEDHFDATSLSVAVRGAHELRPDLAATVEERRVQRRSLAAAHAALYADVLAGR